MRLAAVPHRRFSPDAEGGALVYIAPSAAIVRLDAAAAGVLERFRQPAEFVPDGAPDETMQTARELVAVGLLRPVDDAPPPAPKLPPMPFPLATLVLNVTNKCNLSCTYCYEYGEDRIEQPPAQKPLLPILQTPRPMMSPETACESVDFLLRSAGERQQASITFFGGETLLNFATIEAAVLYAEREAAKRGSRMHFSLTTNATLLTEPIVEFLIAHRFGITVSIDGDPAEQDRHRRYRSGRGSAEVIVPRIRDLIARNRARRGRPIGARVTLTRGAASVLDTYRYLVDELGFDEVGFAPVTSSASRPYALDAAQKDGLLADFAHLADDFVQAALAGREHGFANLNDLLRELHQGTNKAHPCGAGLGLLGVSTEGELGLCHRFVESRQHSLGDVRNGIDEARRGAFLERAHVENKPECSTCFARPVCAGGCYHEAHVHHGDATAANLHYCDWIRGWTDLGLAAYGRIMAGNPAFFSRYDPS